MKKNRLHINKPATLCLYLIFVLLFPLHLLAQSGKIGINTQKPTETLDVNGKIRIREGAQNGYVLVADSVGSAHWTNPAALMNSKGALCITDLGAVGNGIFDNTVIIQRAIDSAALMGCKVCIPAGIYKITGTLTLKAGVVMEGYGMGSTMTGTPFNGSVIKYSGNGWALHITGGSSGLKELTVYDDNNSGAAGCINMEATGSILESCHFTNILISGFTDGTALQLKAQNNGGITYCTFDDVRIRHAKTGIHLIQDNTSFVNSNYFNHGAISGGGFDYCMLVEGGDNNIFNGLVMEP
jgi:hypothetical protein